MRIVAHQRGYSLASQAILSSELTLLTPMEDLTVGRRAVVQRSAPTVAPTMAAQIRPTKVGMAAVVLRRHRRQPTVPSDPLMLL